MKTVKEWFELIKDEKIRKEALENMQTNWKGVECESVNKAIKEGFTWMNTLQSRGYWKNIFESKIELLEEQPPPSPIIEETKMEENFFYGDKFCNDFYDLSEIFDIDEDNVNDLDDGWECVIELSDFESIYDVDAENLCQLLADANEDRLSEDADEEERVLKAIKESVDFDKLNKLLPKLYYPNNAYETITKADLIAWFLTILKQNK